MNNYIYILALVCLPALGMHPKVRSRSQGNSPLVHSRVLAIRQEHRVERHLGYNHNYNLEPIQIPPSAPRFEFEHKVLSPTPSPVPEQAIPINSDAVKIEEIKARTKEVQAISKKKIAAMVLAGSIVSAALTAGVTLAIQFNNCNK